MRLAVREAARCIPEPGGVRPRVGVVVVRSGELLCSAHRGELKPGDHAEYTALEGKLGSTPVAGATLYTTLEPCTSRNIPKMPCAERLIQRKITRVLIGMLDPNPNISGRGLRRLREANIETELFPSNLMAELEELNREFISHFPSAGAAPRSVELAPPDLTGFSTIDHAPLVLAGKGQQATALFPLVAGLHVFKLSHDGSGHFGVWLLDAGGNRLDLLANVSQPFAGSKAVRITSSGQFLLDVAANGAWLVSVVASGPSQPMPVSELPRFVGGGVQFSRGTFVYHIKNHGAEIFDLVLQPILDTHLSISHDSVLSRGQVLQITVAGQSTPAPVTVSLRYMTASGREAIQLIHLPQDHKSARAVP